MSVCVLKWYKNGFGRFHHFSHDDIHDKFVFASSASEILSLEVPRRNLSQKATSLNFWMRCLTPRWPIFTFRWRWSDDWSIDVVDSRSLVLGWIGNGEGPIEALRYREWRLAEERADRCIWHFTRWSMWVVQARFKSLECGWLKMSIGTMDAERARASN